MNAAAPDPRLILIMGDQLSFSLAALREGDRARDRVLLVEVADEARSVPHHQKKIAFIFSCMRHFAQALEDQGWQVDYVPLDAAENSGSFTGEVTRALARTGARGVVVTEPSEWRVLEMVQGWEAAFGQPVTILPDDRFLCTHEAFADWAEGRKQMRMEYFYRDMRRQTGLLMEGDEPVGGRWNFDAENRKPAGADLFMPQPHRVTPDAITAEVLELVEAHFSDHFGELHPFWFGTTHADAEAALDRFIEHALPSFGDFQDAMLRGEKFLYHSLLGLYINVGLLDPLSVCRRAEAAYFSGHAPLNAVEGFIRQIIGWREFVRGIYWLKMPDYAQANYFGNTRPLPDFYWTGETDMACLRAAITQTREEAYAHHIQRLMVTGNFALLAGIDPHAVHEWYLAVYADAFEWVEMPNTIGMTLFADGGVLGSKPYAASGNYINRMSDYCASCAYQVKLKTGEGACPFNALYWHFLDRNRDALQGNPRMAQMYRTWARMSEEKQTETLASAEAFLDTL